MGILCDVIWHQIWTESRPDHNCVDTMQLCILVQTSIFLFNVHISNQGSHFHWYFPVFYPVFLGPEHYAYHYSKAIQAIFHLFDQSVLYFNHGK